MQTGSEVSEGTGASVSGSIAKLASDKHAMLGSSLWQPWHGLSEVKGLEAWDDHERKTSLLFLGPGLTGPQTPYLPLFKYAESIQLDE
jgi:hypothetical protein